MQETTEEIEEGDKRHKRRERLCREICNLMGWEYKTSPTWTSIRKIAKGEAVAISLEKLDEIIERIRS